MASKLLWLDKCKASQLKAIANSTGIPCSGTKSILKTRLLDGLQNPRFALPDSDPDPKNKSWKPQHDIISIDMGIRNLAYCRLILPVDSDSTIPKITEWTRVAISRASIDSLGTKQKEPFDPATYSQHAYALITSFLSYDPPTQILIERQRFRSMGGSSVQEWTLRVNMFEAMLYAVIKTFSAQGLWNGTVYPVAPAMVSKFWLGDANPALAKTRKGAKTKAQKVELVERWLREGKRKLELGASTKKMGQRYLEKRSGRRKPITKPRQVLGTHGYSEEAEIGKLDDLADCLLQGMAWIKWEENRRALMTNGLGALDDLS